MSASEDLFQLVNTMDRNEKGYFKKYGALYGGKKSTHYFKLFDALSKMEEYDEKVLLKKLRGQSFVSHLPVIKNQLFELLLKTLRMYMASHSLKLQTAQEDENLEILLQKGVHNAAEKLMRKIKQDAKDFGDDLRLLNVNLRLRKFTSDKKAKDKDLLIQELLNENKALGNEIYTQQKLQDISHNLLYIVRKERIIRSEKRKQEIEAMVNVPELREDMQYNGFKTKMHYYNCKLFYSVLMDNKELAVTWSRRQVENYQDHPRIIEYDMPNYVMAINNYINTCAYSGKTKEISEILSEFHKLNPKTPAQKARIFEIHSKALVNVLTDTNQYEKAVDELEKILEEMETHRVFLNDVWMLVTRYNYAICCYVLGRLGEALQMLNAILNDKDFDLRKDLRVLARMLNLIVHLDLENEELLEYAVRSARRFMKNEEFYYEFERIFLKYFLQLAKYPARSRKPVYEKFRKECVELFENEPMEKTVLESFDFMEWLDARIEGVSYRDKLAEHCQSI